MRSKSPENTETVNMIEFLSNPKVKLAGVSALLLTTLVSFGISTLQIGLYFMAIVALVDAFVSPVVIHKVNKSGNYQYLLDEVHKFANLAFIVFLAFGFLDQIASDVVARIVFTIATLFVLDYNFNITQVIINSSGSPAPTEEAKGFTKEGQELMDIIEQCEKDKKKDTLISRLGFAIKGYVFKLKFSYGILCDIIFGDKDNLKFLEELNKALGMDHVAENVSFKGKVKMYYKRYVADAFAIVLIVLVLF